MLTRKEWDLLITLAEHPARTFTREELYRRVWGHPEPRGRTLDSTAHRLRLKLHGGFVHGVLGVGYRLADPQGRPDWGKQRFLITDRSQFVVQATCEEEAREIYLDKGGEFVALTELDIRAVQ